MSDDIYYMYLQYCDCELVFAEQELEQQEKKERRSQEADGLGDEEEADGDILTAEKASPLQVSAYDKGNEKIVENVV